LAEGKKVPENPGAGPQDPLLADNTGVERDAYGYEIVDEAKKAHLDFLTAVILLAVSVFVAISGVVYWQQQDVVFYESAGFMPFIIAAGLGVMSLGLLKESLKHDSVKSFVKRLNASLVETARSSNVHKALVGLAIFGVYVFFMLGRMEFWLASFLALGAVLVFVRYDGKWQTALKMVVIAALCVAGIVGLFQFTFNVPMP